MMKKRKKAKLAAKEDTTEAPAPTAEPVASGSGVSASAAVEAPVAETVVTEATPAEVEEAVVDSGSVEETPTVKGKGKAKPRAKKA